MVDVTFKTKLKQIVSLETQERSQFGQYDGHKEKSDYPIQPVQDEDFAFILIETYQ